jgi:hypothetical protein
VPQCKPMSQKRDMGHPNSWRRQTWATRPTNFNTEPGIVLTNTFDPSELIDSPDLFNEDEVLIEGTVSGASTQSVFPIP